jgi:hypothetical protein
VVSSQHKLPFGLSGPKGVFFALFPGLREAEKTAVSRCRYRRGLFQPSSARGFVFMPILLL